MVAQDRNEFGGITARSIGPPLAFSAAESGNHMMTTSRVRTTIPTSRVDEDEHDDPRAASDIVEQGGTFSDVPLEQHEQAQ
ncbi:hypothetical protein [Gordonia sp. NPDC127522]|uniref:hypothetical protein n=1 Tax=Gordonia sp. NPDC127522 TaxID=3345390 RepID=UPI0036422D7A